jgi:hypothetical protein
MHISEAWGQKGTTIATSLSTANQLLSFPGPSSKLFYVWDLEWLRGQHRYADNYIQIYCNPDLVLIARSTPHAQIIHNNFNREISHIVSDFDLEKLIGEING